MTLIDELQVTVKDFLPKPTERIVINDRVGTAAIVSLDFFARLKTYAAAKQITVSAVMDVLRTEIHGS